MPAFIEVTGLKEGGKQQCQWAGGELENRLHLLFSETQLDIQVRRADSFLPLRSARSKVESWQYRAHALPFPFQGSFREGS